MQIILTGKVIHGDNYGKKIGFPTANIDREQYSEDKIKIKYGIYAGYAFLAKKKYKAAIVIGPKDYQGLPKIEAYLIKFKRNIYGKKLTLELTTFIRSYKKFVSEKDLIEQISQDVKDVLKSLT